MDDDRGLDLDDPSINIPYRMAFGLARLRLERLAVGNVYRRDESAEFAKLVRDVMGDFGDSAGPALEAIRLGVADANAGREPRW